MENKNNIIKSPTAYYYALYDVKAGVYAPPFPSKTDDAAKRDIVIALDSAGHIPPADYPADFCLFKLAGWSDCAGYTEILTPENLGTLLQIQCQLRKDSANADLQN